MHPVLNTVAVFDTYMTSTEVTPISCRFPGILFDLEKTFLSLFLVTIDLSVLENFFIIVHTCKHIVRSRPFLGANISRFVLFQTNSDYGKINSA